MKLIIKKSDGSPVRELSLTPDMPPCALGSAKDCDIILDSPSISPKHAELFFSSGAGFGIRDLNSINGVFVNGRRLGRRQAALNPGDAVGLGEFVCSFEREAGDPPAFAGARRRLVALAAVLAVALAALVVLFLRKPRPQEQEQPEPIAAATAVTNKAAAAPAATQTAEPAPDETTQREKALLRAQQLIESAQKIIYEKNDPVAAAEVLNEALKLDPANAAAKGLLEVLKQKKLQDALDEGMRNLKAGNMPAAHAALQTMSRLAPDDARTKKLQAFIAGHEAYQKAKSFFSQGNYAQAAALLENALVPDADAAASMLAEARRQMAIARMFDDFDAAFNAPDQAKAREILSAIFATPALSQQQTKLLEDRRILSGSVAAFHDALAAANHAAAISSGLLLTQSPQMARYPKNRDAIAAELDKLKAALAGSAAQARQQVAGALDAVKKADDAGQAYEAAKLRRAALDVLVVADFVSPADAAPHQADALRKAVMDFTRHAFNQAYIQENNNKYQEAAALYKQILDVAFPYDEFLGKARARLAAIVKWLPQKEQLAIELEKRVSEGEAILPAAAAPAAAHAPAHQDAPPPATPAAAPGAKPQTQDAGVPPQGMIEAPAGKTLESIKSLQGN